MTAPGCERGRAPRAPPSGDLRVAAEGGNADGSCREREAVTRRFEARCCAGGGRDPATVGLRMPMPTEGLRAKSWWSHLVAPCAKPARVI